MNIIAQHIIERGTPSKESDIEKIKTVTLKIGSDIGRGGKVNGVAAALTLRLGGAFDFHASAQ